jgi:hypothetical protein
MNQSFNLTFDAKKFDESLDKNHNDLSFKMKLDMIEQ